MHIRMQGLADDGWGDKRERGLGAWKDLPECGGRPPGGSQLKNISENQGPLLLSLHVSVTLEATS